jgi:putative protease
MLAHEEGYAGEILADSSLYVWNRESAGVIGELCDRIVLPEEAGNRALADVEQVLAPQRRIRLVYGRVPLMVSAGCIRRTVGQCAAGRAERGADGFWYLRDRKNKLFPVRMQCHTDRNLCSNVIYNSVPVSLHDHLGDAGLRSAGMLLCAMTVESAEETEQILRWYRGRIDGEPSARRNDAPVSDYTAGHYRQGAQ